MSAWKGSGSNRSLRVELTGSTPGQTWVEQKSESDLSGGAVVFAAVLDEFVEIINRDAANDGVFTVNGAAITVPAAPDGGFVSTGVMQVTGTASATVTVSGSTKFLINRRA